MGTKDCQDLKPAIEYNFQVPKPWIKFSIKSTISISLIIQYLKIIQNLIYFEYY